MRENRRERSHSCIICLMTAAILTASACNGDGDGGGGGPDLTGFDVPVAIELCRLSLLAYDQLAAFQTAAAFDLPEPYQLEAEFTTNQQYAGETLGDPVVPIAFIATRDDRIYLAFRGTSTVFEWLQDAKIAQVDFTYVVGGGRTEQGFTEIYATVRDDILAKIEELVAAGTYSSLYVTGHSLGGALAVLAALDMVENSGVADVFMYNFGAPRVGDPEGFVPLYDLLLGETSWRVANTRDEVTSQPPTRVFITETYRYAHVQKEYPLTFGQRLDAPLDIVNLSANHSICSYANALCELAADPVDCELQLGGIGGCD